MSLGRSRMSSKSINMSNNSFSFFGSLRECIDDCQDSPLEVDRSSSCCPELTEASFDPSLRDPCIASTRPENSPSSQTMR